MKKSLTIITTFLLISGCSALNKSPIENNTTPVMKEEKTKNQNIFSRFKNWTSVENNKDAYEKISKRFEKKNRDTNRHEPIFKPVLTVKNSLKDFFGEDYEPMRLAEKKREIKFRPAKRIRNKLFGDDDKIVEKNVKNNLAVSNIETDDFEPRVGVIEPIAPLIIEKIEVEQKTSIRKKKEVINTPKVKPVASNIKANKLVRPSNNKAAKPDSVKTARKNSIVASKKQESKPLSKLNKETIIEKPVISEKKIRKVIDPNSPLEWMRPYDGPIAVGFDKGISKGIEFHAPIGTKVKASESGKVVYVGKGFGSYGLMVVLEHRGKFMSCYAYASKILVKEGQIVEKGQIISEMGSVNANKSKLIFEVRKSGRAVNPENLF